MKEKIKKTKENWKKILSSEEFHVLREKGTELPFSSFAPKVLFDSKVMILTQKYDSQLIFSVKA